VFCPCWFWKWPQKFSHPFFSYRNCFQTLYRMIFGTLTFPGTRWYMLTVRKPQMVRDQEKFGNHWLNANKKLLTACQPWNHDNHHSCMWLSCYRCHGQLSRNGVGVWKSDSGHLCCAPEPGSLFWCHAVVSLKFTHGHSFARRGSSGGQTCERFVLLLVFIV